MNIKLIIIIAASIFLTACATETTVPSSDRFIAANYKAADAIIKQLGNKVNPSQPMIVASMVNIDNLNSSSTFGRLVSEQVSARFSQSHYSMIEMKLRDFVYMKQDQGELLLTREIKDVAKSHNAQAIIVGTYALSRYSIFVNIKVIQPSTNVVLAVEDYTLPLNENLEAMVKTDKNR